MLPEIAATSLTPQLALKTLSCSFVTGQRPARNPEPGCSPTPDMVAMLGVLGCGWFLKTVCVLSFRSLVTYSFLRHAFPERLLPTTPHGGDPEKWPTVGSEVPTREPVLVGARGTRMKSISGIPAPPASCETKMHPSHCPRPAPTPTRSQFLTIRLWEMIKQCLF